MDFIIIIILTIFISLVLGWIFSINKRKIVELAENKELDKIAKKYPPNINLCQKYLEKLKNTNTKIEENKEQEASMYIAITNKIIIGNVSDTFTRIQTIAHECLHSIQNRKLLIANFIFSNVYLLYYFTICILGLFNLLQFKMMFLNIFLILSLAVYFIKIYLENDAMIKAKYLAKDYLEGENISSKEEIEKLVKGFDDLNNLGIKYMHYKFFLEVSIKIIIFETICLIIK